MVYVLNVNGTPLMPTERHGHVRKLLNSGKAKVMKHNPFTIQLTYDNPGKIQPVTVGIDPGRTNIDATAVSEDGKPLFSAKVETRNKDIPKLMAKRKTFRQAHRKHVRREKRQRRAKSNNTVMKTGTMERHLPGYTDGKTITCNTIRNKEARFSNRKRKEGWLTPTARQLLLTHENLIRKIASFVPVSRIAIEVNKFAFMELDDPSVTGKAFQNGPLKGFDSDIKKAVWDLQDGKCLLCDDTIETYHHVTERHKNGSETIHNRVGLCQCCHELVHTDDSVKQRLLSKNSGLMKQYAALGVLNQIIPYLIKDMSSEYHVALTTGYATKESRMKNNLPKDHHVDAYLIACSSLQNAKIRLLGHCFHICQFRRHDRQACKREMLNRNYMLNGKKVAVNRHKAFEQTFDSLEEYVESGGRTDCLQVRHTAKAMKNMSRFLPGCQVIENRKVKTILKSASGYYHFDDGSRLQQQKTYATLQNQGLVFVSNT